MSLPRLFTVRAMVLGVVVLMAFVLVYPTLRVYLAQRVELEQLAAQVAAARDLNEELTADLDRWGDPAYVVAQARERLAFVMPGETAYRVADPETVPEVAADDPTRPAEGPARGRDTSTSPWYSTVWDSVRIAGEAEVVRTDELSEGAGENGTAPAGDGDTAAP